MKISVVTVNSYIYSALCIVLK